MKKYKNITIILFLICIFSKGFCQIDTIRVDQANEFKGEIATVYVLVVSTNYNANNDDSSNLFEFLEKSPYPRAHIYSIYNGFFKR